MGKKKEKKAWEGRSGKEKGSTVSSILRSYFERLSVTKNEQIATTACVHLLLRSRVRTIRRVRSRRIWIGVDNLNDAIVCHGRRTKPRVTSARDS